MEWGPIKTAMSHAGDYNEGLLRMMMLSTGNNRQEELADDNSESETETTQNSTGSSATSSSFTKTEDWTTSGSSVDISSSSSFSSGSITPSDILIHKCAVYNYESSTESDVSILGMKNAYTALNDSSMWKI